MKPRVWAKGKLFRFWKFGDDPILTLTCAFTSESDADDELTDYEKDSNEQKITW